ncbi:hypothetical protein ACHAQA_003865 [Verticillium albo-atrum]
MEPKPSLPKSDTSKFSQTSGAMGCSDENLIDAVLSRARNIAPEIRILIWSYVLMHFAKPGRITSILRLNDRGDGYVEQSEDVEIVEIEESGNNNLLRYCNLVDFEDCNAEVKNGIFKSFIFICPTLQALRNFVELAGASKNFNKLQWGNMRIRIPLLDDTEFNPEDLARLRMWKRLDMPHGYREGAEYIVQETLGLISKLGLKVKILLVIRNPWRDYLTLNFLTRTLRTNGNTVEVQVNRKNWALIPSNHWHIGKTVAAVVGNQFRLEFPEDKGDDGDDILALVNHGCRGLHD